MIAAAYVRVSTRDQAEDGLSLDAQLRAIRSHCEANGWQLAEYVEAGLSASKEGTDRPEFRRLLADVEARRVDVVVVHKLDRWSRQMVVTMQTLARISQAGAGFVSLSEHIDMSTPAGRLMLGVLALLAQFYSDNLAAEVSKGRSERAAQGLWNGDLPFGYVSAGSPQLPPVIVPREAELVRGAFERYAGGTLSAEQVAQWLNEQGAEPRSKVGKTRFTKATVSDMLANPFYTGRVRYRGDVLPGVHEAIVAEELFDLVARVRSGRRRLGQALREHTARTYLLRGLARCVQCGHVMWCTPGSSGRSRRYRDASRLKQQRCSTRFESVDAELLEAQVARLVCQMRLPADWQRRLDEMLAAAPDQLEAQARRRSIRARMERLQELRLDGDISRVRYESERAKLRAELEAVDALLGAARSEVPTEVLQGLAGAWPVATEEERAELVSLVFEEVYIDLDAKEVVYVKPRQAMRPLFDILRGEKVGLIDPERVRVESARLYQPVMVLVDEGALYRPAELVRSA